MKFSTIAIAVLFSSMLSHSKSSPSKPSATAKASPWAIQKGFADSPQQKAYKDWQRAFQKDLVAFEKEWDSAWVSFDINSPSDPKLVQKLSGCFVNSIDTGPMGIYLKKVLAKASPRGQMTDPRIFPTGAIFIGLALGNRWELPSEKIDVNAVGYGGAFQDMQRKVELFYVFDDKATERPLDALMKDDLYGSCFPTLHIPDFGVTERDACPALVFARNRSGGLMLYGISKEFGALIAQSMQRQFT